MWIALLTFLGPNAFGAEVAFRANNSLSIVLKPECDLSQFDRISMTLESRSSSDIICGLKFECWKDPDSQRIDPVSFTGGRELLGRGTPRELNFPVESLGFYGFPKGWAGVEQITIRFGFKRATRDPTRLKSASMNPRRIKEIAFGAEAEQRRFCRSCPRRPNACLRGIGLAGLRVQPVAQRSDDPSSSHLPQGERRRAGRPSNNGLFLR